MKNGKTLKWLLTLACLLAAVWAFTLVANAEIVDSGYCGAEGDGSNLTWTLDDVGTLTISGTGEMKGYGCLDYEYYPPTTAPWGGSTPHVERVKIIDIKNGVTSIGKYAFCGCTELTSVTIPNSVKSIEQGAFYGCKALKAVTIPYGVNSIKGATFGFTGLLSVIIPDSVTNIESGAFYCSSLTSVTIPDSVTTIGDFAFEYCGELTSVTIPDSVTSIGDSAFSDCTGLKSVTIGNGVTSIGKYAFHNCSGLKRVNISSIVAWCGISYSSYVDGEGRSNPLSYAHHLFLNGKEVTKLTIPDSVTRIGDCTFSGCTGLTSVTIPDSVTSIGFCAFSGCTGLTSMTIPDNVTSIGIGVFSGCTGLTSVTIGNGVTDIGRSAFYGCTGLESVTIKRLKTWCNISFSNETANPFYYADHLIYKGAEVNDLVLPDGVEDIGSYAFYGCTELMSVTIPDSVTSIGSYAFYGCTGLTSMTIPDNVSSIGWSAFSSCTGLMSVTIGNGVTKIGEQAFKGCTELTILILSGNASLTTTEKQFIDCPSLSSVILGNGITTIAEKQFASFTNLTEVVIPASVTEIKNNAFYNDSKLRTVYYEGTEDEWKNVLIEDGNIALLRADIVYFTQGTAAPENHTEHRWFPGKMITPATCKTEGEREYVCFICGTKKTETVPKTNAHQWDEGKITTPAKCTKDGVKTFTCTVCKATKTEVVNAKGHDWGAWMKLNDTQHQRICGNNNNHKETADHMWDGGVITTPAKCTKDGVKTFTCIGCKATRTETVKASGHKYGDWTKLDNDQHQRVCANNNNHVETADHEWDGGKITTPATCTKDGVKTFTCTVCKATKTEAVKATGHKWDGGKTTTAPTCTTDGVKTFTCTVCKATKTETISAGGHTWGEWQPFNDEQHRRVCGNDKNHVESASHEWDEGIVSRAATCTTDGEITYSCTVCGASVTVPGDPATGHQWGEWTSLNETSHRRVCGNNVTHIETAEHNWDKGTVTKEATETSEGEMTFTCSDCGAKKTEAIPKQEPAQQPGDVDGDGSITAADARLALRASVGLTEKGDVAKDSAGYLACDVDRDGKVTSADARLILRASVGLEDPEKWKP